MHDDDVSHVLFLICLYEGSFEGDILLGCGFMVVWGMKFYGFCCLLFVTTKKFKKYIYIYIYIYINYVKVVEDLITEQNTQKVLIKVRFSD
jgi:hypothetical protein